MSSQLISVILLVLSVGVYYSAAEFLGCRDENNNIVDWFYLYKLPQTLTNVEGKNDGHQFVFTTATQRNNTWSKSTKTIEDPTSIPGYTVSQVYGPEFKDVALLYNDEPPEGKTDGSRGHTKGVLATNTQQGFWLIHSVPHYPATLANGTYWYPQTGRIYGQSFLCITIGASEVEKVGAQLLYNEPHFYSTSFPESYKTLYPTLNRAANMEAVSKAPFWSLNQVLSINGVPFKSFAKTRRFRKELYEDWVAPLLDVDLMVESWLHGPGKLNSNCSAQKKVFNIKEISLENVNATFSSLEDHSKWAVGGQSNWICVGDINREEHQKQRGGGTVCHMSPAVARAYKASIQDFEPCPKPQ